MDFDDFGRGLCSLYDISRKYKENILYDYQHAWDVNNESVIRSCEQKLIKLDKKTLVGYLHQFFRKPSQSKQFSFFILQRENSYALCVLIHLIHVFCIPGQEEKNKVVQVELNEMLRYCVEGVRFDIFERYTSQRLKAKPNFIEIDLLTGQIDPQHKFYLKLCYWDIIVWTKNNTEGCKDFLKKNAHFLVSNIEEILATIGPQREHKGIFISCKILLCLLNWNICKIQTQGILHNRELSAVTYSYTAYQITNILQKLLSFLTDDYISTIFKDYNNHVMDYGKTPEGLCTSETVSNHEFQLKFCNWNRISSKNNNEAYKKFIQMYPEFLVSYIEEMVVQQYKTKTIISPYKTLLCILNWNVFHKKTSTPEVKKSTRHQYTAYKVSSILQKLLLILSEDEIFKASNDYFEQLYTMKSEITEDDFCTGKIEPYHEFLLKLIYFEKLCNTNDDDETLKEFLRRNADFFVSQFEALALGNFSKTKLFACKTLLCLLKWNICDQNTNPITMKIQNCEIKGTCTSTLQDEKSIRYSTTVYKLRTVLQILLSILSEDEIFTSFNNHIKQLYTMNSEITEDDFCTGKIEPYYEFLLKLCYYEKLMNENDDDERCKEFLTRNADLFVSQIKEVVLGENTNKKLACKVLLCLLNWNICNLKSTFTQSKIQNSKLQESYTFQSEAENTTKSSCTVYTVRCVLQNLLSTLTDDDISQVFWEFIEIMHTMKSEITPDGLSIGETDSHHEFKLKLFYWWKICKKNNYEAYVKFIQLYPEVLVSHIQNRLVLCQGTKTKHFYCRILLFILNSNICTLKRVPLLIQKAEKQASSSLATVADSLQNYYCSAETVRSILQNLLSTSSEEEIIITFKKYLGQLYAMNSEITDDDLCTGKIDPYYEFLLKLCHYEKLCNKNTETSREFLQKNADMLVSQIKILVGGNKIKWKTISGTLLLCLLKFNMCTLKTTPLMVQNTEIQACSLDASVADTSTKYSYTANTLWSLLKTLLSTLSEDDMFTTFNNYLGQLYVINSEITEDDLCTGKIESYHEFMLKLCYCEKLCIKKDEKKMKKFLSRNDAFLVSQIEEGVNNEKTQLISCKVLLCLSKWGISNQNTAYKSHENILSQTLTFNAEYQDFINEHALFFLSMVGTVMKKNNITLLINLCDVLCIPYNGQHFHDIIGAVIKLIRYYATQVGVNKKCLGWIIKLRYRVLRHVNDNQKLDTAKKIENLFNLLDDLLTDLNYNSKTLERANNSFKSEMIHHRKKYYTGTCFPSQYYTEEQYEYFASHYQTMELFITRLRELWIAKIKCKVKATQISNKIRNKGRENLIQMEFLQTNTTMSEQDFIYEWKADLEENQLNIKTMEDRLKKIKMVDKRVDEMVKKLKLYEMLLLFMMTLIVMVGVSNGHHKSAKLKKYLSLKYEYATASLYLLWCSGDIEVHPGPSLNKKSLAHDSSIERRWIQNISPKIIFRLPEHEQSKYKPTKKERNDKENREHFKALLKTCLEEKVHVPKMYLAEINAWEIMEYKLLHRLFVYRCEFETIIASLQDFFICGGSTKDLTDINVSLDTELKTNDITMILGKDHRPTDKSQLIVYITRHIAGISIKCAHGKDPDAKWDGLWDLPLKNWPNDIILFDPNNRGKYTIPGQKLIPDLELVDILLTLPQVTIPQKYKDIVDAFRSMRKSKKDKSINKQHKAELCSTFKRINSLEKLDYALKNLWKSGIFTEEVHNNLKKWWTTGAVDTTDNQNLSQVDIKDAEKKRRPHILMNISTKSLTLTVEQSDANSSQVSYDFPFSDECVPLKTMATNVHQTTIHKPSSDSCQMVNAKIHLTVSPKPDACSADNQINLIIIPPDEMIALNSGLPYDLYPIRQKILESDVKHQHDMSSHETAVCSTIHFDKPTSSTNQIRQLNQDIAISGQPGPILCTPNQSTTNSNDISSVTKDSQNPDFHMQVFPTSDIGSSDSISSVNSESGNEDGDKINIPNEGHVLLTDSDYSSDSSNICVSKTNMKKRKCMEEDRNEMKKRKVPSLKQDKKPKETNHRKDDSSMDKSTIFNTNMELLQDCLQIDLDSFDFDDQTFDVKLNALDNQDKNRQICDKDRNFMNGETQISNKNTNVSVYDTNVSSDLEMFLQEMIYIESEKMSQMKTSLTEV